MNHPYATEPRKTKPVAPCTTNPDLFFPHRNEHDKLVAAKAICATCPISLECLQLAHDNGEKHGVWGGIEFPTALYNSQTVPVAA